MFLRYIEQVLPSLGEQDVQLATITSLRSRVRVTAVEPDPVAALKGDARLATVVRNARRRPRNDRSPKTC